MFVFGVCVVLFLVVFTGDMIYAFFNYVGGIFSHLFVIGLGLVVLMVLL